MSKKKTVTKKKRGGQISPLRHAQIRVTEFLKAMGFSKAEALGRVAEAALRQNPDEWDERFENPETRPQDLLTDERKMISNAASREKSRLKPDREKHKEKLKKKMEKDFAANWGEGWLEYELENSCVRASDALSDNEIESQIREHRVDGYDQNVPAHLQSDSANLNIGSVEGRWLFSDDAEEMGVSDGYFPVRDWCKDPRCRGTRKWIYLRTERGGWIRVREPHVHCEECGRTWSAQDRGRPIENILTQEMGEVPRVLCRPCFENWWWNKKNEERAGRPSLAKFVTRPFTIVGKVRSTRVTAEVDRDGTIHWDGQTYATPTVAARAVLGHPVDGWHFWKFERSPDDWVELDELRSHEKRR